MSRPFMGHGLVIKAGLHDQEQGKYGVSDWLMEHPNARALVGWLVMVLAGTLGALGLIGGYVAAWMVGR